MSLNPAFQTAVAYRQGMIEQNQAAAAQAPMLAIQALGVGLQAQAQSQRAQFEMQSMVLQTQLQIEQTKAKQAMQVMEFDLKSRQLNLQEQQNRQEYEWKKQEFDANKEFNALRLTQEKSKVLAQRNETLADTFLGAQFAKGVTQEQILLGADPEGMTEFAQTYPEAAAVLGTRLNTAREATKADLSGQIATLALARDKALFDSKASPQTRALAEEYYGKQLQPLEDKVAAIEKRPAKNMSYSGISSKLAAFKMSGPTMDPKDGVAVLAEVRARRDALGPRTPETEAAHDELDKLDQTAYERMGMVKPPEAEGPPKPTPLQAALAEAAAAQMKIQTQQARTQDPARLVENKKIAEDTAYVNAFEATVVPKASGVLDEIIQRADNVESVAEAQKLQSIMSAGIEATKRGVSGIGPASARRALTATEAPANRIGPMAVGAPFTPVQKTVRSFTRSELDALAEDPSYENVKRILSRLEVR